MISTCDVRLIVDGNEIGTGVATSVQSGLLDGVVPADSAGLGRLGTVRRLSGFKDMTDQGQHLAIRPRGQPHVVIRELNLGSTTLWTIFCNA